MNCGMAEFHLSAKQISRAAGRSAVAAAAYRHGARMEIEHDGRVVDYSRKLGVEAGGIELPDDAPDWAVDRFGGEDVNAASQRLWNDVEAVEAKSKRHATAQLAREYEIALPVELTPEQNVELLKSYLRETVVQQGMIADWSFHNIEGNPHAHVMLTMRSLEQDGFGKKERSWNARPLIVEHRAAFAAKANDALERAGFDARIDHRSYQERGIDIEPQAKKGPVATAYERSGVTLDVVAQHKDIAARNAAFLADNPEYFLRLVTAQKAVFTEDDLAREIHKRVGDDDFAPLFEKLRNSDELVKVGVRKWGPGKADQKPLLTTRSQLSMEQGLIERADEMARSTVQGAAMFPEYEIQNEMLSEEQRVAVTAMASPNRLSVVTGYAGAGKSLAVSEAKRIWEERGYEVFGAALAGKAVDELAKSSGVESRTIASWDSRMITGSFTASPKFVMVLDEAGMVGSRQMDGFIRRVEAAGGKLVLIGDAQQLQPIASGAALRAVAERIGDATISTIRRQHDPEHREIAKALATSAPQAETAIHKLDKRGEVFAHETSYGAINTIAEKMVEVDPSASSVALAYTNADVAALNDATRALMIENERVSADGVEIERAGRTITFGAGERIITNQSVPEAGVSKGAFGTIESLTPTTIGVRFDSSGELTELPAKALHSFDHGYAVTIHKSQGATVDRSFVLPSDYMDRQVSYVALTRHRSGVEVHMPRDRFESVGDMADVLSKTRLQTFSAKDDLDRAATPGFGLDARLPHLQRRDVTATIEHGAQASVFTDPHLHEVSERGMGLLAAGASSGAGVAPVLALDGDGGERLEEPSLYIDQLVAKQSVFSAEDLSAAVMADTKDSETYLRAFSEVAMDARLVMLADVGPEQTERLYSTAARVRDEIKMADTAISMAQTSHYGANDERSALALRNHGATLSDQQRIAAQHALSNQRLSAITGVAGAGKSYMMGSVRAAAEGLGFEVRGVALAGKAVASLEEGSGIKSRTLASLFAGFDRGETLDQKTILVLDEAGMVDGASMSRLLSAVDEAKCKLVLVGDAEQLQPIGPGGAYRGIIERVGHVELSEVRRQETAWMAEATKGLSGTSKQAQAAVQAYADNGRIHHAGSRQAAIQQLADRHEAALGADQAILAFRRADVNAINRAVIENRKDWREPMTYRAEGKQIDVARGDRIQLTRPDKSLGVKNGEAGTVIETREGGFILQMGALDSERFVYIKPNEYDAFAHGFATTIHKSQGMTAGQVHLFADRSMNKHMMYVGMSRHKADLNVVTPHGPVEGQKVLENAVSKTAHQSLTLDYITDPDRSYEEVMGSARYNDLERDLRYSDVKAAMVAARQDPVTQERAQASRLNDASQSLIGDIARAVIGGGLSLAQQGDRYSTAAVGMYRKASHIADHMEKTARMVGAIPPRTAKQDAVNELITKLKDDLTTRIAQSEINAGKAYDAARHKEIQANIDWIMKPGELNPSQRRAASRLASALRRQEDIAASASKAISAAGFDVDSVTQEHRRMAMSLAEDRIVALSEPTILDHRMAERMVEMIDAKDKLETATYEAGIERIEQVRAAAYQHPRFEADNGLIRSRTNLPDALRDSTMEAITKAEPKLQAQAYFGDTDALRAINNELTQRQAEVMAVHMSHVRHSASGKETIKALPEMRRLFAEKARLGMLVQEMTPKQATEALHRLRVRYGRDAVTELAQAGRLSNAGVFGIGTNLGPPTLVKAEMKALLKQSQQHRPLARVLALVIKPVRALGLSR